MGAELQYVSELQSRVQALEAEKTANTNMVAAFNQTVANDKELRAEMYAYIKPLAEEAANNRVNIATLQAELKCSNEKAELREQILEGKLRDVELLYRAYVRYLEQSGSVDRNRYLALLPEVITSSPKIRGARVIFLGFQAFTCSVAECAAACMEAAADVSGIFIGGGSDVYVNEAAASFATAAKDFGGVNRRTLKSELCPEAELLRTGIFDPDVFHTASPLPRASIA